MTGSRRTSQSVALAALLAAAAGSIEAYSVVDLGAFAGAQTGNVLFGSIAISRWQWSIAVRYLLPIVAFVVGVIAARSMFTPQVARFVLRPYRAILIFEVTLLVLMGLLPSSTPRELTSVVITVAVAAQASTFRTIVDVGYNSAYATGNMMNTVTAAHAGFVNRDRDELVRAGRVASVIGCYAFGAMIGAGVTRELGRHGILAGAVLLGLALALFIADEHSDG